MWEYIFYAVGVLIYFILLWGIPFSTEGSNMEGLAFVIQMHIGVIGGLALVALFIYAGARSGILH